MGVQLNSRKKRNCSLLTACNKVKSCCWWIKLDHSRVLVKSKSHWNGMAYTQSHPPVRQAMGILTSSLGVEVWNRFDMILFVGVLGPRHCLPTPTTIAPGLLSNCSSSKVQFLECTSLRVCILYCSSFRHFSPKALHSDMIPFCCHSKHTITIYMLLIP